MRKGPAMLREAAKTVEKNDKTYGTPFEDMTRTAVMWEQILGVPVTASQVALCMVAVKVSRLVQTPNHVDSALDIAGYAAVMRECQES